jgi:DNA topoisomerase-3
VVLLPALVEGQVLDGRFSPVAKVTTPPQRHSDATLLGAMESAGKTIDDEALRLAMKDCGLGTPATRAAVIETLVKRDYVIRTKQHLVPTALGIALIETLPVASLASPELTGAWEARLARIARGEESRAAFMADIARYVAETVDAIRGTNPPAAPSGTAAATDNDSATASPRISSSRGRRRKEPTHSTHAARPSVRTRDPSVPTRDPLVRTPDVSVETNDPSVRTRDASVRTRNLVRTRDRSVRMQDPSVRTHDPSVRTHDPSVRTHDPSVGTREPSVRTREPKPATIAAELPCPRCSVGALITGSRGWGCSRWRDGCGFVIWFETGGRRVSAAQLRDLVTRGKTRKARFRSEQGAEIEGRLVLDPDRDGGSAHVEPA